jgi:hypothetical protein
MLYFFKKSRDNNILNWSKWSRVNLSNSQPNSWGYHNCIKKQTKINYEIRSPSKLLLKDEFEKKINIKRTKEFIWFNPPNSWLKLWEWNCLIKNKLNQIKKNKLCGDFTVKIHGSLSHKSQWIRIYFYIYKYSIWSVIFCFAQLNLFIPN